MAVKYRIEYCNKESDTARLDIDVRDYAGQIYPIEGTGDLFILEYKRSDDYILSTIADIQIFSDANFNIDGLKTSDETELKAFFYVNNVLKWQGYILPDFFQTGITGTDAISMTATDRLSVLKDVPLDYSLDKLSYIQLITECLAKTGLSLNCNVVADFMLDGMPSTFHIMNCYVDHSRITNRNKLLSAYDTLRSILVMLNAQIVQWAGEWWIVNRYQLRNGGGRVYNYTTSGTFNTSGTFTPASIPFGMVEANGRRSIEPVASQTSIFMEFGGVKRYPQDYEFRNYNNGYAGWTEGNGFTCSVSSKELLGYTAQYVAIEGTRDVRPRMWQANAAPLIYGKTVDLIEAPYLKSTPLVNKIEGTINVDVQVSATGANEYSLPFIILIDNKRTDDAKERYYCYGINGIEKLSGTALNANINKTGFNEVIFYDENLPATAAISASKKINFTINPTDVGVASFIGTEFSIVIYGTSFSGTVKTYIEEASIGISNVGNGKGVLYRTDQGAGGYSKKSDSDTTIFGDHLSQGINGFFYAYSQDELSIHSYLGGNIRTGSTSPNDALVDPLLLHSVRQRARMNSKAKNILNVDFSTTFNPLAIYTCNATSYVVRSARHDFLRTRTEIELEENASQSLTKVDYVYTYFGDEKEKGISSLSGISGGGSTGGGASHMHANKDIIDQLSQVNLDVLALLEIDENDNLKVNTNLYSIGELSAYGIGSSGGGGGTGSTVIWGTESAVAVPLTVEGVTKTLSLASHTHSGYLTSETDPTVPDHVKAITQTQITNWDSYGTSAHSHLNKSLLDTYTQTESDLADAVAKKHTHSNLSILNATTASFTTADESKLDGLSNYTHPANHDPSIITQDPYNRFFTDIERTKLSGIAAGAEVNVQSDWNAISGDAYILNKPTSMPASDVSAWAKASTKPSYTASEIGGLGTSYRWLTDTYISTWNAKEPAITKLTAFNKNFGTTAGTVAEGNDSRINNGQTAFGWGNHSSAGYALNSALTVHINNVDNPHSVTKAQIGLGNVDNTSDANKPVSTATQTALNLKLNKSIFDDLFEKVEVSTGVYAIKAKYNFYSVGEVSAYGAGSGTGGGGGSMVVWGIESAGAVPLTVEGVTKSLSLALHTHSGYLTSETDPTVPDHVKTITTGDITNWNSYGTSVHSHLNKTTLDAITAAYTTEEKSKLTGIAAGAEVNVQSDWNAASGDAYILNKPDLDYLSLSGGTVDGIINTTAWYEVNGQTAIWGDETALYLGDHSTPMYIQASSLYYSHPTLGAGNIWNFINANRTDVNWAAATLTAQTDILTPFYTWSNATDRNSLKAFLNLFDVDTAGNLVVKTNLYSTGEVTAYKSGTGISGLTLIGDINANGKNITNLLSVSNQQSMITMGFGSISFDVAGYDNQLTIADDGIYVNTRIEATGLSLSGTAQATEFKFGLWSFKEESGNMVISYNGTAKATIQSSRTNSNL